MKKFTLVINLIISIIYFQGQYNLSIAQCTKPLNVADSLEFERVKGDLYFDQYEWKDTLDECRIVYMGFWFDFPEDLNFPFLEKLFYVPEGPISQSIEIQSFPNLEEIVIGDAVIDKDLVISDLPKLKELSFSGSRIENPGSLTLQNLPNLNNFEALGSSNIISVQDIFIGDFPGLKKMSWNGEFLPNVSNFPALEELVLNGTYDHYSNTNSHPEAQLHNFSNFPSLKKLIILRFEFENSITNFNELQNLEEIEIQWNVLSGEIPNFNNPMLKSIRLNYNQLEGIIPDFDTPLLEELELFQNNLSGSIPDFGNIPLLRKLYLSGNQLTGVIPNFGNLPVLNELYTCGDSNEFTGPVPALENCPLLDLDNIDFSCVGPAPENNGNLVSESDSLVLVNFYKATNGDNWEESEGWLTRNLEAWWGIELTDTLGEKRVTKILIRGIPDEVSLPTLDLPFLEELILDFNNFTGELPDLSNLSNLKILNLGANNFTGELPDLSTLAQLETINLSQNLFTGNLPDFAEQPNLKTLNLAYNDLTGEIPNFNHPSLTELDLSNNLLAGSIPNFATLPILVDLNLSGNLLQGAIPDFDNLMRLGYLNLSNNTLTGNIPDFSNLSNLLELNIGDNLLNGVLPDFANLPVLEGLHLGNNQLEGQLPNFSKLPNLLELSVCDNRFLGLVPNFNLSPNLNISTIDFSCIQSAKVKGTVYYDANENCMFDEGDTTIPNGLISVNNGLNYQPVDENGNYEVAVEVGTAVVTFIQTSPLWQSNCENTHTITSLTVNEVTELNFANQPNIECTELSVDIGTPFLRRCFKNTYRVEYCNKGTQPAVDAYIEIDFDESIIPLEASLPFEADNNLLIFQLGEVGIGECGSFTVIDSVACEAPLFSTGCVEAHIYPDGYCEEPSSIWDRANLKVNAFCLNDDSIQFVIENVGEDMADISRYKMYVEDLFTAQGEFKLQNGASKVLSYEATGATYRVAVEQTPGHPSQDNPQAFFEFCGDGNFSTGFINSQLLPDKDEFLDIDCEEIIGSYDPNDKLVTPTGVGESHDIYKGDELTYKIRFQNTGNDTAFTVILVDTLDFEHLNISTLEILNSSHPYTLSIEDAQILTFTFNDILLVDSTTNEAASHGFVSFKIDQFKENEIGDVIENTAYIYFDYNEAIVTPTVFNTIAEPRVAPNFQFIPLTVGIDNAFINHLFAKVYPNPASEAFYLELPDEVLHQYPKLQLEIYNTKGQALMTHAFDKTEQSVNISDLKNGMHYYKVFSKNTVIANGKLLVQ